MAISKLDLSNVRNIRTACLEPSAELNLIVGQNGAGKSSLLEALYILGRARSFRTSLASQVISFEQDSLSVSCVVMEGDSSPKSRIGVVLSRRHREISVLGRAVTSSVDLIRTLPVSLIHSGNVGLLGDTPRLRRHFLDWGVFHVEPGFLRHWRAYTRVLNQRNAFLRTSKGSNTRLVSVWDQELDRWANEISSARKTYLEALELRLVAILAGLYPTEEITLRFSPGWQPNEAPLIFALEKEFASDKKSGFTRSGPHKGDFSLLVGGKPARNFFSRGQMKTLTIALYLAQIQLQNQSGAQSGCLLIDDLCSELDSYNRQLVLALLSNNGSQHFITAADSSLVEEVRQRQGAVFHVEHGSVTRAS